MINRMIMCFLSLLIAFTGSEAFADWKPNKPITMMVMFPPGGWVGGGGTGRRDPVNKQCYLASTSVILVSISVIFDMFWDGSELICILYGRQNLVSIFSIFSKKH